jgi:Leucine-rich repeat (LRR) protein
MNKNAMIMLLVLMLVFLTGIGLPSCSSDVVEIPDSDLNILIRKAIGKLEGDIYPWELEEVKILKASREDMFEISGVSGMIYDLTGLEYCTNLEYLNLSNNPIKDITPLASLNRLNTLILSKTGISDITPLDSLTLLETLDLSDNQIRDISALASLTNLTTLYLFNNQISDISSLSSLDNLKVLCLGLRWSVTQSVMSPIVSGYSNQVSNLSPLRNLTSLEYLNLNANEVSNLKPISGSVTYFV